MATTSTPSPIIWPPHALSYILLLAGLLLDLYFYHATLSVAYYAFAALSVHATLWLNACVLVKPLGLHRRLCAVRRHEAFARVGPLNQALVNMYLRGCFLVPNLVGPIWICWFMNAHNVYLDNLAHLYGFVIGLMHVPLMLSVGLKLLLPAAFAVPVWAIERVSELVYLLSKHIPESPAAAAQEMLRWLRDLLRGIPGRITRLLDREVLRSEHRYMWTAVYGVLAMYVMILLTTVVVPCALWLPRLGVKFFADLLMTAGDLLFEMGMLAEKLAVKRVLWEGRGAWMHVLM
ncbi:hypothetical protein CkaCkLH20_10167 [Colletotrichum karsti]|uniref:Uncharacterized protein n=1 Tax=Colletotrichum karsti TaxID=1095194 RepID=A0A9P6LH78_9PEZI|nr:uncharacterized protein CkaCkLH20_10167 [Colletotrichum karsti]KAF9872340.1 hypothetical protein CkaCkLH20_10167 [Colletotrichum karsti]